MKNHLEMRLGNVPDVDKLPRPSAMVRERAVRKIMKCRYRNPDPLPRTQPFAGMKMEVHSAVSMRFALGRLFRAWNVVKSFFRGR